MIFTTGASLIFTSSSSWVDKALIGIGIITKYDEASSLGGSFNWAYFILGAILICIGILMYCFSKKKLYVLNINGYSNKRLENYVSKLKSNTRL